MKNIDNQIKKINTLQKRLEKEINELNKPLSKYLDFKFYVTTRYTYKLCILVEYNCTTIPISSIAPFLQRGKKISLEEILNFDNE